MVTWPPVEVNSHVEDFAIEQFLDLNTLLKHDRQVAEKEIAGDVIVLELNDVIDQVLHSLHLVELQSIVDCVCVVVVVAFPLRCFYFVNYRVLV